MFFPRDYCADCAHWLYREGIYQCTLFSINRIPDRDSRCGGRFKVPRNM